MKKIIFLHTFIMVMLAFTATGFAATGLVLTVQPGAWVIRGGVKTALTVKAEIKVNDELTTDSTGSVQVIFPDDTTISLGADTTVAVADFVFDESDKKASFSADMAQGAARFVTGKIVEQNRDGFTVATPQATVGIRGTTFAVNVTDKGVTSVVGLKVDSAFPISVVNKATGAVDSITQAGLAVDASTSGNRPYKAPPGQFSQISSSVNGSAKPVASSETQTSQGSSTVAATPKTQISQESSTAAATSEMQTSQEGSTVAASSGEATQATPLIAAVSATPATTGAAPAMASVAPVAAVTPSAMSGALYATEPAAAQALTQSAGKQPTDVFSVAGVTPPPTMPGIDHTHTTATYSGFLYNSNDGSYAVGSANGAFSFTASLGAGSGRITNTQLTITNNYAAGLTAKQIGSAHVNSGNFTVNVKTDHVPVGIGGMDQRPHYTGHMTGDFSGDDVTGKYTIYNDHNQTFLGAGETDFKGSKQ